MAHPFEKNPKASVTEPQKTFGAWKIQIFDAEPQEDVRTAVANILTEAGYKEGIDFKGVEDLGRGAVGLQGVPEVLEEIKARLAGRIELFTRIEIEDSLRGGVVAVIDDTCMYYAG